MQQYLLHTHTYKHIVLGFLFGLVLFFACIVPAQAQTKTVSELEKMIQASNMFVPALRDRHEDIHSLVVHFSDLAAKQMASLRKTISEQGMKLLTKHIWPGNVRELKNFIERVYILTPSDFVDVHDLRFAGLLDKREASANQQVDITDMSTFREARAEFEKDYLIKKIAENGGNISKTAETIGLERSYLHRKIKAYGIEANI